MDTATVPGVGDYVGDVSYYLYNREENKPYCEPNGLGIT